MPEINPFAALNNIGQSANDRKGIADNFDTFLQLLTTQLRNQNPLDPLDTNQFTQQLVQFTEVEQSIRSNENLEKLLSLSAANAITGAVGFIGKSVTTSGNEAQLENGRASWPYTAADDAATATFTVRDKDGNQVFTESRAVSAGSDQFVWDGRTDAGGISPNGTYTMSVAGTASNGTTVSISTAQSGLVEGVDMSGNSVLLTVGGRQVKLEDVSSINLAPAAS